MKYFCCDDTTQLITIIREHANIECMTIKPNLGKAFFDFKDLLCLRQLTYGEYSDYFGRYQTANLADIPNLQELCLLNNVELELAFLKSLFSNPNFNKLSFINLAAHQQDALLDFFQNDASKGIQLILDHSNGYMLDQEEGPMIVCGNPLNAALMPYAKVLNYQYMGSEKDDDELRFVTRKRFQRKMMKAMKANDKEAIAELLKHIDSLELSVGQVGCFRMIIQSVLEVNALYLDNTQLQFFYELMQDEDFLPLLQQVFTNLEELRMVNVAHDFFPDLHYFKSLRLLDITSADFMQTEDLFLMEHIAHLNSLEELSLNNIFTSEVLDFRQHPHLTSIKMHNVDLEDMYFVDNSVLKELSISYCPKWIGLTKEYRKNAALERLNLYGEELYLNEEFCYFPELKELTINSAATDAYYLPKEIANLKKLEMLSVCFLMGLKGIPQEVLELKNLRMLLLIGVFESFPKEVFLLPNLIGISLQSTYLPHIPEELNACKALSIDINGGGIEKLSMHQVKRLGRAFKFTTADLSQMDVAKFYTSRSDVKWGLDKHYAFMSIMMGTYADDADETFDISLYYDMLELEDSMISSRFDQHIHAFNINKKSIVDEGIPHGTYLYVHGVLSSNEQQLSVQLSTLGIHLTNNLDEKVTHVLIGNAGDYEQRLSEHTYTFCTESQLMTYLSHHGNKQLMTKEGKKMIPQIEQLLYSAEDQNKLLALEMIKNIGLPTELMLSLIVLQKYTENNDIRQNCKCLLKTYCDFPQLLSFSEKDHPSPLRWIEDEFKYNNIFYELNSPHFERKTDEDHLGDICTHLLWKLSHEAEVLVELVNALESGMISVNIPYFYMRRNEIAADSNKYLTYE